MPLDPFEGRLQFLDQLRHLSASQSASLKLSMFALKHRALHEDLYSCILEELTSTTLNDKVNIFFFLSNLMEQSEKARFIPYGDMIRRDLDRIVADVVPLDGGAANIAPARKVLKDLFEKECITQSQYATAALMLDQRATISSDDDVQPVKTFFSQDEIRRRMEEDRERHKLLRESIWMIPQNAGPDAEFNMMWEATSSFSEDDLEYMHEENVKKGIRL